MKKSLMLWTAATADTITAILHRGDVAALAQLDPVGVPEPLRRACADRCMFEGRRHFGKADQVDTMSLGEITACRQTARAWMRERRRWMGLPTTAPAPIRRRRVVHATAPPTVGAA